MITKSIRNSIQFKGIDKSENGFIRDLEGVIKQEHIEMSLLRRKRMVLQLGSTRNKQIGPLVQVQVSEVLREHIIQIPRSRREREENTPCASLENS